MVCFVRSSGSPDKWSGSCSHQIHSFWFIYYRSLFAWLIFVVSFLDMIPLKINFGRLLYEQAYEIYVRKLCHFSITLSFFVAISFCELHFQPFYVSLSISLIQQCVYIYCFDYSNSFDGCGAGGSVCVCVCANDRFDKWKLCFKPQKMRK